MNYRPRIFFTVTMGDRCGAARENADVQDRDAGVKWFRARKDEVEPIKGPIVEAEIKHSLKGRRKKPALHLDKIIPLDPWGAFAICGFAPFAERKPSFANSAFLRITKFDPAASRLQMWKDFHTFRAGKSKWNIN